MKPHNMQLVGVPEDTLASVKAAQAWGAGRRRRLHRCRHCGLERHEIVPPGGPVNFKHLPKTCPGPSAVSA